MFHTGKRQHVSELQSNITNKLYRVHLIFVNPQKLMAAMYERHVAQKKTGLVRGRLSLTGRYCLSTIQITCDWEEYM